MNGEFVLTKAMAKEFASLDDAKGRRRSGMFVAEGRKCVETLLDGGFVARHVFVEAGAGIELPGAVEVKRGFLRDITRLSATPSVIAFLSCHRPRRSCHRPNSAEIILFWRSTECRIPEISARYFARPTGWVCARWWHRKIRWIYSILRRCRHRWVRLRT